MILADLASTIGKTPVIKLHSISFNSNTFIVKTESRNPAGSIKDRIGYAMIDDALKSGALKPGMEIIEPTSGNTGIALAAIGKAFGIPTSIVMPESMSEERKRIIKGFDAKLILTDAKKGMSGAIEKASALNNENPEKYYMPNQFSNPANPAIHIITTGPEIDIDTDSKVDMIVAGIGTGGTITGIGWYFKNLKKHSAIIVGVEPEESPVLTQIMAGKEAKPAPHGIQGIGAGFVPPVLDMSVVDKITTVKTLDAYEYASKIMKDEGIFCGISGGAAIYGAIKTAEELNLENKNIVVILPDSGERYLSTDLYK